MMASRIALPAGGHSQPLIRLAGRKCKHSASYLIKTYSGSLALLMKQGWEAMRGIWQFFHTSLFLLKPLHKHTQWPSDCQQAGRVFSVSSNARKTQWPLHISSSTFLLLCWKEWVIEILLISWHFRPIICFISTSAYYSSQAVLIRRCFSSSY